MSKTVHEVALKNKKREIDYGKEFNRTFGISLHGFVDILTGFDIVKFGEWLEVPDGISTKDFVEEKYGDKGVKIIEALIS